MCNKDLRCYLNNTEIIKNRLSSLSYFLKANIEKFTIVTVRNYLVVFLVIGDKLC